MPFRRHMASKGEIDEGLYSRQLYVMGREGQRRMAASNVLVCGLNGLGVETVKNIALAGVKGVTLFDPTPVSFGDLGANPFVTASDVGVGRAEAASARLSELNPYVRVSVMGAGAAGPEQRGSLQSTDVAEWQARCEGHSVCVLCDCATDGTLVACSEACRACGCVLIVAEARGVFASVFCDFGASWLVSDVDGEPGVSCLVASITQTSPALVHVVDEQRHGLSVGDAVTMTSCQGMEDLNGRTFEVTRVASPYAYEIACDATQLGPYVSSGYATHSKTGGATMSHRPASEALADPGEFLISDFAKLGRAAELHACFRALHAWRAANDGKVPAPDDTTQAQQVVDFLAPGAAADASTKKLCDALARCAWGEVAPMTSALGGIVGQEVLKACSAKFRPITQWFYFDAAECLPEDRATAGGFAPRGDADDALRAVIGEATIQKLHALNYFLVGAGAIGCEMLKNWALMGVGLESHGGAVIITDMDRIEKSNLSRQLLFRAADIGKAKSTAAVLAAKRINARLGVRALELRVGAETEDVFDDAFYSSLHGVCTALDNVDARLYMDSKCVTYGLPMLESGTLGTKGNTQVVAPHRTEPYGATRDPPEKSIPVCTLKNFPNRIEHTLQWARDWFEGAFKQSVDDVNAYLSARGTDAFEKRLGAQPSTKLETLRRVKTALVDARPTTFEDCVVWARLEFEDSFNNSIQQLLHNFPRYQLTTAGVPFWSGAKRAPTAIAFDPLDDLHLEYIRSAATLRATNYNINPDCATRNDVAELRAALDRVIVPDFAPRDGVKISANEAEEKKAADAANVDVDDVDAVCAQLLKNLPSPATLAGFELSGSEFEKDDDAHMAFVAACSNLRARNYAIPEADLHQSRLIAGKIIPAIATTTALVSGLICLELLKIVQNKPVDQLKSGFCNLALPLFAFSEPAPPSKTVSKLGGNRKGQEWAWTAWDSIPIDRPDLTLKDLIEYFDDEFGLEVSMLSYGVSILYSSFANAKKVKERMPMRVTDIIELVTKKRIEASRQYVTLEVMLQDEDMEEVELPHVRLRIK